MLTHRIYSQGSVISSLTNILSGIGFTAGGEEYDSFVASVAYATLDGCRLFMTEVEGHLPTWKDLSKRWLISIDFGRTEPEALEHLASYPNSMVRIPHGRNVLTRPGFCPVQSFHHKAFMFSKGSQEQIESIGLFIGSANLTRSGLTAGAETSVASIIKQPTSDGEEISVTSALEWKRCFDEMWKLSPDVVEVIDLYKTKRSKLDIAHEFNEDNSEYSLLHSEGNDQTANGEMVLLMRNAWIFWVETGTLSRNRGPDIPGSQLDLRRGSRVFFGFSPMPVSRNTILGEILIKYDTNPWTIRTMRYGDNHMDKINLPIPGSEGPDTYDDSVLVFERLGLIDQSGRNKFRCKICNEDEFQNILSLSIKYNTLFTMRGGRRYGVLQNI